MNIVNILNGTQAEGSGLLALIVLTIVLAIYLAVRKKAPIEQEIEETKEVKNASPLDLNDEDATVASLVAAIEAREEFHKNVQIISIRKVN